MVILRFKIHSKPDKSDELMAALAGDHHSGASHPRASSTFDIATGPARSRSVRCDGGL